MQSLSDFRNQIDKIDDQLIKLLADRFAITKRIGSYKAHKGLPLRDKEREDKHISGLRSRAQELGVDPDLVQAIIRIIIDQTLEEHRRIATGKQYDI